MKKFRLVSLANANDNGLFDDIVCARIVYTIGMFLNPNDILFFGGGTDVNPKLYRQQRLYTTEKPHESRDAEEQIAFYEAMRGKAACLGYCRGSQFLTVMNGGTLIQDVLRHGTSHDIIVPKKEATKAGVSPTFKATSTHHQMMNPFSLDEKKYDILAASSERLSISHTTKEPYYKIGMPYHATTKDYSGYHLSSDKVPLEPEIVFYPETRSLAVQGHPEYLENTADFPRYVKHLVLTKLLNIDK